MLKLFKQNMIRQIVVTIILATLIWDRAVIFGEAMLPSDVFSPLYDILFSWLGSRPRTATMVGLVVVLAEGLILNEMFSRCGLTSQKSLMPMFLYVLFMSQGHNLTISPMLLVNLFVLLGCRELLQTGQPNVTVKNISSAATFVSLACLCYFPAITLLLPLLYMMPTFKMYRLNDWNGLLLGLLAPIILACAFWLVGGKTGEVVNQIAATFSHVHLSLTDLSVMDIVFSITMALFAIIVGIAGLGNHNGRTTNYKNNVRVVGAPLMAGVLMIPYTGLPLCLNGMAVTLAFAATVFFESAEHRKWIYNLILVALIVLTFISTL